MFRDDICVLVKKLNNTTRRERVSFNFECDIVVNMLSQHMLKKQVSVSKIGVEVKKILLHKCALRHT